jgi:N-acetylneuraminate synthase
MVLGARIIERHVTLDRTFWGSDQMASVEPIGCFKLIKGIRELEISLGDVGPRMIADSEQAKRKTLNGK